MVVVLEFAYLFVVSYSSFSFPEYSFFFLEALNEEEGF